LKTGFEETGQTETGRYKLHFFRYFDFTTEKKREGGGGGRGGGEKNSKRNSHGYPEKRRSHQIPAAARTALERGGRGLVKRAQNEKEKGERPSETKGQ